MQDFNNVFEYKFPIEINKNKVQYNNEGCIYCHDVSRDPKTN